MKFTRGSPMNRHVERVEPEEARRILRRLEFHHTPKHASWLKQVEIELSVLCGQCLGKRRVPEEEMLSREISAWERERTERGATIAWRVTAEDAREKLACLYPPQSQWRCTSFYG